MWNTSHKPARLAGSVSFAFTGSSVNSRFVLQTDNLASFRFAAFIEELTR